MTNTRPLTHRHATHDWSCVCNAWQEMTVALFITRVDGRDDQQLSIGILSNITCIDAAVNFNSLLYAT